MPIKCSVLATRFRLYAFNSSNKVNRKRLEFRNYANEAGIQLTFAKCGNRKSKNQDPKHFHLNFSRKSSLQKNGEALRKKSEGNVTS